jgi:FAD:protein FMN transferase
MGTVVGITAPPDTSDATISAAQRWLHEVDAVFSTYRADSVVSGLRDGRIAPDDVPADVREIIVLCDLLHEQTYGYFDARTRPWNRFDPSGVVKGWAAERAARLLIDHGVVHACVNAAGDVQVHGGRPDGAPWRIGVIDPAGPNRILRVVTGAELAVATSGVAERGPHVWTPDDAPAEEVASATVVGPSLTLADGYATAAVAMGRRAPKLLDRLPAEYEVYIVWPDGTSWETPGFKAWMG